MFREPTAPAQAVFRPRRSLGRRLALVLLPLVLIPVILMGLTAYLRSRDLLREQAEGQLSSATSIQAATLLEWGELRGQRLQLGSQIQALRDPLGELLHGNLTESERAATADLAREQLNSLRSSEGQTLFSHTLLVRPSTGEIVVSTNPSWEGEVLDPELSAKLNDSARTSFGVFDDPILSQGTLAILTGVPMRSGMTESADSMLVGVNLETRVGSLMEELQIFSQQRGVFREQTGVTYLVAEPNVILELPRYSMAPEAILSSGHPVFELIPTEEAGTSAYETIDGTAVLGSYEWLPMLELGVLIEVPQSTVFAGLETLVPFTIVLIVAAGLLSLLVVLLATGRMLQPLSRLAEFAQRIATGEWSYRVPEDRQDEIGAVAQALNRMAEDLSISYATLESRVEERTRQVRTAAEVARAATSIPTLEELLRQAVELIRDRFGYSYAGIFLIEGGEMRANLRAATGEVGAALLARRHSLEVGSNSLIGWVTSHGEPRVASDVEEDPLHLRNELLPETRSEAALPLKVGDTILGALDVQSRSPDAFSEEDIEVLQTLADQLSAAIQNARLAQTSVAAAERARLISDVTRQLGGLLDVDQVLSTAALSLHQALGRPEIMIKLTSGDEGNAQYSEFEEFSG